MHENALTSIIKSNFSKMKDWKSRNYKAGKHYLLKRDIIETLNILSGSNIVAMLKDVLSI